VCVCVLQTLPLTFTRTINTRGSFVMTSLNFYEKEWVHVGLMSAQSTFSAKAIQNLHLACSCESCAYAMYVRRSCPRQWVLRLSRLLAKQITTTQPLRFCLMRIAYDASTETCKLYCVMKHKVFCCVLLLVHVTSFCFVLFFISGTLRSSKIRPGGILVT
jgi:hypothetical protein